MVKKEKLLTYIMDCYRSGEYNKGKPEKKVNEKFLKEITAKVNKYAIVDWTDFSSRCYELKILLHRNQEILDDDTALIHKLKGKRNDLRIFISALEPYFYLFVEETRYLELENKWVFNTIEEYDKETKEVLEKVRDYFIEESFEEIPKEYISLTVPGVETGLKEFNEANVFDCLFTDLVKIK